MQLIAIIARFFFHEIEWHHERSIRDKLTGLYNRRHFEEQAKSFLKNNNAHCYLAVLDIDHFKPINDKYGHLNGDVVLETIAELLLTFFSKDVVARYGGEEFVILLREQSESDVKKKLTKFRQTIARYPFTVADDTVTVTVSIGLSKLDRESDLMTSFSRADKALYNAKFSGRNQMVTT
ncbi:MAG: GGDEF domain-containing protein [Vibrio sp.]